MCAEVGPQSWEGAGGAEMPQEFVGCPADQAALARQVQADPVDAVFVVVVQEEVAGQLSCTMALKSWPLASFSTYSWTSAQDLNKNSSGWLVRLPDLSSSAAVAMRRSAVPPPVKATGTPRSRKARTSPIASVLPRHSTASA